MRDYRNNECRRFVLIGLQKEKICFSYAGFHKRETTLTSSRNAAGEDFTYVISSIKNGWADPSIFITQRIKFNNLKDAFPTLADTVTNVIKATVELDERFSGGN